MAQTNIITTVAGNGTFGYSGDGGLATSAEVSPFGIVADAQGNIYFSQGAVIRKVNNLGIVSTIAGNGTSGFSGDGGPAILAQFNDCLDLAIDVQGNLYVIDYVNFRIRKIDTSGNVTTIAGNGTAGYSGDGGSATLAKINGPYGLAVDVSGSVYFGDVFDNVVRKVTSSGIISTFAGNGSGGFSGDGGAATSAKLSVPRGVCIDNFGNVFISDEDNNRIRKVNSGGIITTVAGNGSATDTGDGRSAIHAGINTPEDGIMVDAAGNIYLVDRSNAKIRVVNSSGIIQTLAGNGTTGFLGDGGSAGSCELYTPIQIAVDEIGNILVADKGNNRVRKIFGPLPNIISDSFSMYVNSHCSSLNLVIVTPTFSPEITAVTYFGDGLSISSNTLAGYGGGFATITHNYSSSGTYTIKTILYDGAIPVDSVSYSYTSYLCGTLPIKFYYDAAANCTFDSSVDPYFQLPVLAEIDSNGFPVDTISATSGFYYDAKGNSSDVYAVKVINSPGTFASCPTPSGIVYDTLNSLNNYPTKYIGFHCSTSTGFDLTESKITIAGRHKAVGVIQASNMHCNTTTSSVTMNFSNKYVFESSYPAPTSVIGNTVTWDIGTLSSVLPPQLINFTLQIPTPGDMSTWLVPGDTVNSIMIVNPFPGDIDTGNNTIHILDTVKSSYDPNYMAVTPAFYILPNSSLQYAVDFENTGNDTAHNIYVMDTLSPNVDPHTLRVVSASGVMNIQFLYSSTYTIAKFEFPNINLLDSSHHNQCDGIVIFNIKTKGGLSEGTEIYNHAGIFFDDNPVVMTDTVTNIISTITGMDSVCVGTSILQSELAGGGTWSRSNSNAMIASGLVTGVNPGMDTISYILTDPAGADTLKKIVTILPLPNAGTITGSSVICPATTTTFTCSELAGTWSISNGHATSSGGSVTGVSSGLDTLLHTTTNGCGTAVAYIAFTVSPSPDAGSISGNDSLCIGDTILLIDSISGGIWTATNSHAIVSLGTVTGITAGTDVINYTVSNFCGTVNATKIITVNSIPTSGEITGDSVLCSGSSTMLLESASAGLWSTSNLLISTIDPVTGLVVALAEGLDTVRYTVGNICGNTTSRKILTVNPLPVPITGTTNFCKGSTDTLTDIVGGAWSSSNNSIATIDTMGHASGINFGTTTISYTLGTGCFTSIVLEIMQNPSPIAGVLESCIGDTIRLTDSVTDGIWSSSDTAIVKINSISGTITAKANGSSVITYLASDGCYSTDTFTVNSCTENINSINDQLAIDIYPNPAFSEFAVVNNGLYLANSKLEIFDVSGKLIETHVLNEHNEQISTIDLVAGVYTCKIFIGDQYVIARKIVVMK